MDGGSSVNFWRFILEYFAVDAICTFCKICKSLHNSKSYWKRGRIEYEKNKIAIGTKIGTYYEIEIKFQILELLDIAQIMELSDIAQSGGRGGITP